MKQANRTETGRGRRALVIAAVTFAGTLGTIVSLAAPAGATTPTTTTTQVSATSITLGPSGSVSDTASVQGNATHGSPTGSVAFYVCKIASTQTLTTGPCAVLPANHVTTNGLSAGAGDSSAATSSPFTPTSAGTWCFSASYGGDANYGGSTDNTSAGNLDANECVLVMPEPVTITSSSSAASIPLGASATVTDWVTVAGTFVPGSPTGTLVYYACQTGTTQTLTSGPCAASGTPEDPGEALVAGAGATSSATSNPFTPTSAGTWCFSTTYSGDTNYGAAADNTAVGNADPDECFLVTPAASASSTSVSAASVTFGPSGTVTDTVTVSGTSVVGPPSGAVTFYACQTGTSQTLTTGPSAATGTPEDASESLTPSVGATSKATSVSFAPSAPGTWCFSVTYGGDSNYAGSTDNTSSLNLDASECLLVTLDTSSTATRVSAATITVGPSGQVTDSVTVTGNPDEGAPGGTVDFYVCGPTTADALCVSTSTPEGTPMLSSASSDSSSAESQVFVPSRGIYCFAAVYVPGAGSGYSGSSDNVTGAVDTNECVSVNAAPYSITSASSATAVRGQFFTFTVTTTPTSPAPRITRQMKGGKLPWEIKLANNGNGTATISGTAGPKRAGAYHITIVATWGTGKNKHVATQAFTLTVSP